MKNTKSLIFLFMSLQLFSLQVFALYEASKELLVLQAQFGNISSENIIVYLDREILSEQLKKEKEPKFRAQIINQFLSERAGATVSEASAQQIADYFSIGSNMAIPPMPTLESNKKICAVVPADPHLSDLEVAQQLLYWDYFHNTDEYRDKKINPKNVTSARNARYLTNIHETFHCLDTKFWPKANSLSQELDLIMHQAEGFADAAALIYLAGSIHENLIDQRAIFRIAGSYMVGKYVDRLGITAGFGINYAVVYSYYPILFAVRDHLKTKLRSLTLKETIDLATKIVLENSFDENFQNAVLNYQTRPEEQLQNIESFKNGNNKLREKFLEIEKFRNNYVEAVNWAFENLFVN